MTYRGKFVVYIEELRSVPYLVDTQGEHYTLDMLEGAVTQGGARCLDPDPASTPQRLRRRNVIRAEDSTWTEDIDA